MGLFDFLRSSPEVRDTTVDADALLDALVQTEITPETALSIPVVSACVSYICNTISALPVKMYDDTKEITDDYRLSIINLDSGDLLDSREICKQMIKDYLLYGSAYCVVNWSGNRVKNFKYVKPTAVSAISGYDPVDKKVEYLINAKKYQSYKIMRLLRYTQDGIKGQGLPIEIAPELETYLSAIKYAKRVYKTGGARGVVQASERLTQDAVNELKKAWMALYSEDDSKVMVLNKGLEYKAIGNSVADNELSETMDRAYRDICSAFGLNSKVIDGGMTEVDAMQVIQCCIAPIATALSNMYTRYLLLESEKEKGLKFRVDIDELLTANVLERYQSHSIAISHGFKTIDDVRREEGLPPIDAPIVKIGGLADVLYNTDDGTIYTPNTGVTVDSNGVTLDKGGERDGNQS